MEYQQYETGEGLHQCSWTVWAFVSNFLGGLETLAAAKVCGFEPNPCMHPQQRR